jgi:hypothetical protein
MECKERDREREGGNGEEEGDPFTVPLSLYPTLLHFYMLCRTQHSRAQHAREESSIG